MDITQLKWKWYRQEAHTSHLAPLLTFPDHSAQGVPPRFSETSSLPFPMTASFTSVCRGSIFFLCTINGPTFVPQHAQPHSPSWIVSHFEWHKPVHFRSLSLKQLLQTARWQPNWLQARYQGEQHTSQIAQY